VSSGYTFRTFDAPVGKIGKVCIGDCPAKHGTGIAESGGARSKLEAASVNITAFQWLRFSVPCTQP
jgi:hypothetical protein